MTFNSKYQAHVKYMLNQQILLFFNLQKYLAIATKLLCLSFELKRN